MAEANAPRERRLPRAALIAVAALVMIALGADVIAPFPPDAQFRDSILKPPAWCAGGDLRFFLGSDDIGRDVLSRLIHGARISLAAGLGVAVCALLVGGGLGVLVAAQRGWCEAVVMRIMDMLLAVPGLLTAVAVAAILEPGLFNAAAAVTLAAVPHFARLARAVALAEAAKDYVRATRALGGGTMRQVLVMAPNCAAPLAAQAALAFSVGVSDVAALGFLGLGVQPPTAEWGRMLATSVAYFQSAPWAVIAPGAAIVTTTVIFNALGDLAHKKTG
jgi:dipeptide transport system permease protein